MEKIKITVELEDYKRDALEFFLRKNDSSIQKRLETSLEELYESMVPPDIREYVESINSVPKPKAKKQFKNTKKEVSENEFSGDNSLA